jgi:hypothetical protein
VHRALTARTAENPSEERTLATAARAHGQVIEVIALGSLPRVLVDKCSVRAGIEEVTMADLAAIPAGPQKRT